MSFEHVYIPATDARQTQTLLLLHGTGGTEHDLIEVGKSLLPGAALLSPRGKVNEHGMNRWFRRLSEGVFDEDDIRRQAADLATFLADAREKLGIGSLTGLGYSNGANIGASLMLLHPHVLDNLVMWRGMNPLVVDPVPNLNGKKVLMCNGTLDPMAPLASAEQVSKAFLEGGATLEQVQIPTGHGLTQGDFLTTSEWLGKL